MMNSVRALLAPGLCCAGFMIAGFAHGTPDTSGLHWSSPREWKDDAGRVVKRVDAQGRMFLLSWDEAGQLVRIGGFAGKVKPGKPEGVMPQGGESWVHCFLYGPQGLIGEIDCKGDRHEFSQPCRVDEKVGTALQDHRHLGDQGATPAASVHPAQKWQYDLSGRIQAVEKE